MDKRINRALAALVKGYGPKTIADLVGVGEITLLRITSGIPIAAATERRLLTRLKQLRDSSPSTSDAATG